MNFHKSILMTGVVAALMMTSSCQKSVTDPTAAVPATTQQVPLDQPKVERPKFDAEVMNGNIVQSACFVTVINEDPPPEKFSAAEGQTLTVEGWTADAEFNVPESITFIIQNGSTAYEYPATLGPDRARAAEVFKKPQLVNAGYTTELDLTGVQAGEYTMFIGQTTSGVTKYCRVDNKYLLVK